MNGGRRKVERMSMENGCKDSKEHWNLDEYVHGYILHTLAYRNTLR